MKLQEFLDTAPRGEAARLARALGCSEARISEYKRGRRIPRPDRAAEISRLTLGRVSLSELCPSCDWATVRAALRAKSRPVGD